MTRLVEFADTDAVGIAHFTAFIRYMEEAEHAFYRSLGFSVHEHFGEEIRGFPRLAVSCRFVMPLWFEDVVQVHLLVRRKQVKSIDYDFIFRKLDDAGEPGMIAAKGEMTVIYASKNNVNLKINALALPARIADQIDDAPPHVLNVDEPAR